MTTYRHKERGTTLEALQVTEETVAQIAVWTGGQIVDEKNENDEIQQGINVPTYEGNARASLGDYVVLVGNYFDVAPAARFEDTHEPASAYATTAPEPVEGDARESKIMSEGDATN